MKSILKHRLFTTLFTIIILSVTTLLSGCNFPSRQSSPGEGSTNPPVADDNKTQTGGQTDYLVIPLTSGEVSPISACSYDLLHTVCTIQLYDSADYNILNECFALIDKYEKLFSRTLEGSEVYNINHGSGTTFTVSDDIKDILER